jgi:hypothetical protein
VPRVRQHTLEVVGADRYSELERGAVLLPARFSIRVIVDDRRRIVAAHGFGELNSGRHEFTSWFVEER